MFFQPILLLAEMKKERSCSRKNEKRNRSSLFCSAFRSAVYMEKGMASSDAVHPLKYRVSSARYPMSSVERAKKRGQKRPFLASFFACFLLQNHNILWYNRSIFPFYHKTSSLSLLQRAPSHQTYPPAKPPPPDTPASSYTSHPWPVFPDYTTHTQPSQLQAFRLHP